MKLSETDVNHTINPKIYFSIDIGKK